MVTPGQATCDLIGAFIYATEMTRSLKVWPSSYIRTEGSLSSGLFHSPAGDGYLLASSHAWATNELSWCVDSATWGSQGGGKRFVKTSVMMGELIILKIRQQDSVCNLTGFFWLVLKYSAPWINSGTPRRGAGRENYMFRRSPWTNIHRNRLIGESLAQVSNVCD